MDPSKISRSDPEETPSGLLLSPSYLLFPSAPQALLGPQPSYTPPESTCLFCFTTLCRSVPEREHYFQREGCKYQGKIVPEVGGPIFWVTATYGCSVSLS